MTIKIPDFSNAKVLVLGDVMLDRYWTGGTSRISPEAPIPVVHVKDIQERPGGAANVALNIASLGGQAILLGVTGKDANSDVLEACLKESNVSCEFLRQDDAETITKLRILSQHQQLLRVDFERKIEPNQDALLAKFETVLNDVDVVVLSDYGKGTLRYPQPFIMAAKALNKPVFVDPKNSNFEVYRNATMITPNFKEFQEAVGKCGNEETVIAKAHELLHVCHLENLLVTRGAEGMTLFRQDVAESHIPTRAQEVFDVTGAGDTVIATLAASVAVGKSYSKAVRIANAAAGITVSKLGAATVSVPELRRALQQTDASGVMSENQLSIVVEDAKAHNETVVMTNGCFDILHAGHVHYLEQAKRLGDRLIVAVNDDASVSRLKGDSRPINSLEKRMAVLSGLSSVDWVVPFSEDTPERLITCLMPDILVKGGDYSVEEIAGAKAIMEAGGQVKILDFLDGFSTTGLIDKLSSEEI